MNDKPTGNLSSDKPLLDPAEDKLGYAPFAEHLANSICEMMPPDGLVMAIYAPWGMGKSTVLEFVVHYLQKREEEHQPIIMRFNPWWFSGQEALTQYFFIQLQLVLSTRLKEIGKKVGEFFSTVSKVTSKIPGLEITGLVDEILLKKSDVTQLKSKIADGLREQNTRILIIIDDIDRLTAEEIRQLFGLIKSVADFPNVIYLLAFDKQVVVDALAVSQGISGEAYLEKIVQVPFDLPLPDDLALGALLVSTLNHIFGDVQPDLFDQSRWSGLYRYGVRHFFQSPRDVTRFTNALRVTYRAVRNEVNVVDFLAIETVRIFCPRVYDLVRRNPELFIDSIEMNLRTDAVRKFHDAWIDDLPDDDKEAILTLMSMMFPRLRDMLRIPGGIFSIPMMYDNSPADSWRKHGRICVSEMFSVYFRLQVPENNISNEAMRTMLSVLDNRDEFEKKLLEMVSEADQSGVSKVARFLDKFEDFTNDVSTNNVQSIVLALFNVNDEVVGVQDQEFFTMFDNNMRVWRIIHRLIGRLGEVERFEILKTCFEEGLSISRIADETIYLGYEYGKYEAKEKSNNEKTVDEEHLVILEQIALNRISKASQEKDSFLERPNLRQILRLWIDLASEKEVQGWVSKTTTDDNYFIRFLEAFLWEGHSYSAAESKTFYRLDPLWVESYLAPSTIIDRIDTLKSRSDLTQNQKRALNQFSREYAIRQQGKDPENELRLNQNPADVAE